MSSLHSAPTHGHPRSGYNTCVFFFLRVEPTESCCQRPKTKKNFKLALTHPAPIPIPLPHSHHATDIENGLMKNQREPGGGAQAAPIRRRRRRKPFVWPWNRYDPPMLPPGWLITVVGWFLHCLIGQGRPLRKHGERTRERSLRYFIYRVDAIAFLQLCGETFQAYVYFESGYPGEAMPHVLAMLAFTSMLFAHATALTAVRYTVPTIFIFGSVVSIIGQIEGWIAVVWLTFRVLHMDFDGFLPGVDHGEANFIVPMPAWSDIITVISLSSCLVQSISGIFLIRTMTVLVIRRVERKAARKLRAKRMALAEAKEAAAGGKGEKKKKRRREKSDGGSSDGSGDGSSDGSGSSGSDDDDAAARARATAAGDGARGGGEETLQSVQAFFHESVLRRRERRRRRARQFVWRDQGGQR